MKTSIAIVIAAIIIAAAVVYSATATQNVQHHRDPETPRPQIGF